MEANDKSYIIGSGNIVIQNVSGCNIAIDLNSNQRFEIPKYLTHYLPILIEDNLIGREKELLLLEKVTLDNRIVVLISGLGGIGKTTLVKAFLQKNETHYNHIAWISADYGIFDAFGRNKNLIHHLRLELFKVKDPITKCLAILRRMSELKGNNLLILDNAEIDITNSDFFGALPKPPNWTVIATSRHQLQVSNNRFNDFFKLPILLYAIDRLYKSPETLPSSEPYFF